MAAWLRAGAPADSVPVPFENADHAHGWLPDGYDPDAFDVDEATEAMRVWAAGEHLPWHSLPDPLADLIKTQRGTSWNVVTDWLESLGPRTPLALTDAEVQQATRPWLAVLHAVGQGVKLTSAGYLPPATVEQIAQASGVTEWWIGKANREDLTPPVAELREGAQALGLLRKSKGVLMPTARAKAAVHEPRALVEVVLAKLPLGKTFEAEAGWFTALGLAAEESGRAVQAAVAQILNDRGWRIKGGGTITKQAADSWAQPTLSPLDAMAGGYRRLDDDLMRKLARAVLLGMA